MRCLGFGRQHSGGEFLIGILVAMVYLAGCGRDAASKALDSDANGYVCTGCATKFYTERKLFPNRCPSCRSGAIEMVLGYACSEDGHVTMAPRARGAACEQCRKFTTAVVIPRESDLKAWGARLCSATEVE